jgi:hypothetical protein
MATRLVNTNSKESIIDACYLAFDPADKLNGSLYLGFPITEQDQSAAEPSAEMRALFESVINKMRDAGLWSNEPFSVVPDKHRQAYKDQLILKEALELEDSERIALPQGAIIARFDHEKFPSNDERWQAWVSFFA